MAQYKVPQDVEADDKLLGPFSFRQFVYLLIAGGLIALAVALFQIFPLLAIIPLPPVLLLAALALPLKKDQPMETYLAALVSYYLKPHTRTWMPGQKESTIEITAPKVVEETRTRDISGEEATHRLSFLADIVDTEGYAIKGMGPSRVNEEIVTEANTTSDIFETTHFNNLENTIAKDENERHAEVIKEMKEAIERNESFGTAEIKKTSEDDEAPKIRKTSGESMTTEKVSSEGRPASEEKKSSAKLATAEPTKQNEEKNKKVEPIHAKPSIIELANNPDYSVETIAKEANRINKKEEGEVFISLH